MVRGAQVWWMAILLSTGPAFAVDVPPWWPYEQALKPQWRMEGEKLAATEERRAEGELILARFYGVQGDLPREILHLNRFFQCEPKEASLLGLGWHEKASVLRQFGEDSPRGQAIDSYSRFYNHEFAIRAGIESPKLMEAWRLIDKGEYGESGRIVEELSMTDESKTDASMLASLGFLRSEIEGHRHRDPNYTKEALLKLMDPDQIGPEKFLADPNLVVAAVVSMERLFQPDAAIELIAAASQRRKIIAPVIPETEMARNELMLCRWDEAADYLAKAQKILLTYPPGIRQEAGKNLDFAVADYYLVTGHPEAALSLLERLRSDFLRPGFTTEHGSYYLAGLHLRFRMASDRILSLQLASLRHAGLAVSAKALPGAIALAWTRERSEILFRQELATCITKADPGRDIGTLLFVPPWMLPEMRNILGVGTFNRLFTKFHPEGQRLGILQSLLQGTVVSENTPPLLKALAFASEKNAARKMEAWGITHSATMIVGSELPVSSLPEDCPAGGWIRFDPPGFGLRMASTSPEGGALAVTTANQEYNLPVKWPPTVAGRIETLNKALLNADPAWGISRQLSIEGRNLDLIGGNVTP